eukprot:TRINITY_DN38303_c0_g1_i1.p3 TRINITY_DN38303_c0_g1~~TRINITY_DN38303_c0_g1_i1.p3  ORF type:complete len:258 (-),score=8.64 TRINITY_DN38303_c0_g1_i1:228-1001(-)
MNLSDTEDAHPLSKLEGSPNIVRGVALVFFSFHVEHPAQAGKFPFLRFNQTILTNNTSLKTEDSSRLWGPPPSVKLHSHRCLPLKQVGMFKEISISLSEAMKKGGVGAVFLINAHPQGGKRYNPPEPKDATVKSALFIVVVDEVLVNGKKFNKVLFPLPFVFIQKKSLKSSLDKSKFVHIFTKQEKVVSPPEMGEPTPIIILLALHSEALAAPKSNVKNLKKITHIHHGRFDHGIVDKGALRRPLDNASIVGKSGSV